MATMFKNRPVKPTGVVNINGWRLKNYEITTDGAPIPADTLEAARRTLEDLLPSPPEEEAGVGFLITHQGMQAVWVLADLWAGDILSQHTLSAPLENPSAFSRVPAGGPVACVFELPVHDHERASFIRHFLESDPDAPGYLSDAFAIPASPPSAPAPSSIPAPSPNPVAPDTRPTTTSGQSTLEIPTFASDRLTLRMFRDEDFEGMARFYAHPVSEFYGGPVGREEAWRKFAAYPGHWALRGFGPWALEERASGTFVGVCGLWYPDGWPEPEITWALLPEHHGKGFATEAGLRALRAAYEHFGWDTAISVIALDNPASAAVATRMGATLEKEVKYRYGTANLYRHAPPNQLLA